MSGAIAGIAIATVGTVGSFIQAGEQRNLQRQANAEAKKAMEEARKKLEINYMDKLGIQKEPYELQREALLSQGAEAIQAAQQAEGRNLAATAGRIQMAQNEAQAGIRTAMGKELTDLEKLSAQEESRLRDVGVQLDIGDVQGAQLAARNAQEAAARATAQGFQGLTSVGQQALALAPLYSKTGETQQGSAPPADNYVMANRAPSVPQFPQQNPGTTFLPSYLWQYGSAPLPPSNAIMMNQQNPAFSTQQFVPNYMYPNTTVPYKQ